MKFDPFKWSEINDGKGQSKAGRLWLRASVPGRWYLVCQGYEILAGISWEIDLSLAEASSWRYEGAEDARIFQFDPPPLTFEASGTCFLNPDVGRQESAAVREVHETVRLFRLEQKQALSQIRQEYAIMEKQRAAHARVTDPASAVPDPAPVVPAPVQDPNPAAV